MGILQKNAIDILPEYPDYASVKISRSGKKTGWGRKYNNTIDRVYVSVPPVDISCVQQFEFDIYIDNYSAFLNAVRGKTLRFFIASGHGRYDNRSTFDFFSQIKKSGWNHIVIDRTAIVNDYNTDYSCTGWFGLEFWGGGGEDNPIAETKVRIANICGIYGKEKSGNSGETREKTLNLPYYADYKLKNDKNGFAEGTITVKVNTDTNSATDIVPFWANESGKLEGYSSLYVFRITGEITEFNIGPGVVIPNGATKLLLYAKDYNNGEITDDCIALNLPYGAGVSKNPGKVITEFQVVSDVHIGGGGLNWATYTDMLTDIKEISPESSGLFINGDVTNCGADAEYKKHAELHAAISGAPRYYMSIGNHEFYMARDNGDTQKKVKERFVSYIRLPDGSVPPGQHYDFWLNGYHFVFLGDDEITSDYLSATYMDETLRWLKSTLKKNRDRNRPIFLFSHPPIQATVAGSLGEFKGFTGVYGDNAVRLKKVLGDFPEVIMFNGHQHIGLGYPVTMRAPDREMPTIFNTASASQVATIRDRVKKKGSGSEGYYVYVYSDRVILRGRDFKAKKWIPSAYFCVKTGVQE